MTQYLASVVVAVAVTTLASTEGRAQTAPMPKPRVSINLPDVARRSVVADPSALENAALTVGGVDKRSERDGGLVRNARQGHVPAVCFQPSNLSPEAIEKLVRKAAIAEGIDDDFAVAVAKKESRLGRQRVSPVGAMGTMQLMPGTARELDVDQPCDPEQNIAAGVRYLRQMLDEFGGHPMLAAAAYNAGARRVHQHKGLPPYRETLNYVAAVIGDAAGIEVAFKDVGAKKRNSVPPAARAVRVQESAPTATPAEQPSRTRGTGPWVGGLVQHF